MTHSEQIVDFFVMKGYRVTLGEILQHSWGYRFIQRAHDLRKKGIIIRLVKQDHAVPSNNLYEMTHFDKSGQGSLL